MYAIQYTNGPVRIEITNNVKVNIIKKKDINKAEIYL